jgi:hypothetical protein
MANVTGDSRAGLLHHVELYAGGPDTDAVYFEDPERLKVELVAPE